MKIIKLVALSAILASAGAAFADGDTGHEKHSAPVAKEQKAWGIGGAEEEVQSTITLRMTNEMRFIPDQITVQQGDTLRLRIENKGKVPHELVLGTPESLEQHSQMMIKSPSMNHDAPYIAHVAPGKTVDLLWKFNQPGDFEFACLIAGHIQAGMRGTITVTAQAAPAVKE